MDYSTILLTGITCGAFGFGGAIIALKVEMSGILARATDEMDAYIGSLPDRLAADPTFITKLTGPFIKSAMEQLGVSKAPKGNSTVNIMGMKLPTSLVEAILPMIGGMGKSAVTEVAKSALLP